MCTLIVAFHVFDEYPIVVAANRDELLDRPSEKPQVRGNDGMILSPKDLVRNGSWIGVNKFGVFAALTNRLDVRSKPGRMSRGALIMDALRYESALGAYIDTYTMNGEHFNGFNMVIADKNDMFLLRGDGNVIRRHPYKAGPLVVSNHGVGRDIIPGTPRRVAGVLNEWQNKKLGDCEATPESLVSLLNIHDDKRYGTCINEPDNNYGTKSSSIIRLASGHDSDSWHYWHRERSGSGHICGDSFDPGITLEIQ